MAADPADLWQPEASKAVSDWSAQFDPKRLEMLRAPGARQSSSTYGNIGAEAKRAFDDAAHKLLERVRDLLTRCNGLDQIGTPELAATLLVDPLERHARDAIPNTRQLANLGFINVALLENILGQPRQQIQAAASILRARLQNEVQLRRTQIEQAAQSAAKQSRNEWWQRAANQVTVINFGFASIGFLSGYAAGKFDLLGKLLKLIGFDGSSPTSNY